MGSVVDEREEFTVLVTGFAPFRDQYPRNPSWEIASSLPSYLPPLRPKHPSTPSAPLIPEVRILVHPSPVRVNYKFVRGLVPKLWDEEEEKALGKRYDVVIHIGMAGPRNMYQIERRGHRDGYKSKDVDGEVLEDEEKEEEKRYWEGIPRELETEVDVEDVLGRWKGYSPDDADLRISEDAGHYLCDFIYFSSLAHLYAHHPDRKRKVLFLHVPADANEVTIPRGRELAVNLIRAVVESEMRKREEEKGSA